MTPVAAGIALVVTDLDGTLWHLDHDVHQRTLDAIVELERRRVPLLVATGRRVRRTVEPLARFGLAPPAVCLNGALGLDLATGERFHRATIAAEHATAILRTFRAHGLQPCVYVDGDDVAVYVDPAPSTHPEHLASFGGDSAVDDLARVCIEEPVLAFSVLGRPEGQLAAVAEAVATAGVGVPHLSGDRGYGGHTLTVAGPAMSKWLGVVAYCERHGIPSDRVLAIGDGPTNDELLAGAAVAVVPSDAHPRALAVADHVVGAALDGGWCELLDLLDA